MKNIILQNIKNYDFERMCVDIIDGIHQNSNQNLIILELKIKICYLWFLKWKYVENIIFNIEIIMDI